MRRFEFTITLLLLTIVLPAAAQRPDPQRALRGIDTFIQRALEEQKIPGASVGVVVGDRVVLLEGYGFRDVEQRLPMTPDTMIPIASVTKQFTVAALGTLVRQGKLDWDRPVRDYLPDFRLHDDYATLRATPRDLVTHRIGLPRHDSAWFGSTLSREELYGNLRNYPFSRDIRTRYQYNNFMFMTAGYLSGRLAGKSYEQQVHDALLTPLGMTRTNFSLAEVAADADHATGYQLDNERRIVRDAFESAEQMAPTGGLNSTARDMVKWLQMMLAGGELAGRRILQTADVQAMMQPQMPIGPSLFPEIGFRSYGMGLTVENYRGFEVAQHGGNMPGAATSVLMVPKERIGVVVLTNRSGARLRDGLTYEIVDRLLGLPSANLVARNAELERRGWAAEDSARDAGVTVRREGTRPSHQLEEYAGRYVAPGYGPIDISFGDGTLRMSYHGFSAPLDHWHYDVFRTPEDKTSRLDGARVQFHSDLEGEISGVALPIEPAVPPILFARQPPAEMQERSFLEQFVGTYDLAGIDVNIVLREDGVLQFVQLGRTLELVPLRGTLFRVKDIAGTSVEFLAGASGLYDRLALHSGSSRIAERKAASR